MIDLKTLADYPAPWRCELDQDGITCVYSYPGDALTFKQVCKTHGAAIAQAICDWRNAWQIQMERHWTALHEANENNDPRTWWVENAQNKPLPMGECKPDPTTAILAAAKWLEENPHD